jgi:hypothetical protein
MKSHELANALSTLARLLKAGPNVELSQLNIRDSFGGPHSSQNLAVNLSTLVSLSSVDKSKWMELIYEYKFPIDVRPRDGSRDIIGKLFAYLEANPLAQEKLKSSATRSTSQSSPELMKALSTLLRDTRNEPPTEGN